jgi:hypothetical protein
MQRLRYDKYANLTKTKKQVILANNPLTTPIRYQKSIINQSIYQKIARSLTMLQKTIKIKQIKIEFNYITTLRKITNIRK